MSEQNGEVSLVELIEIEREISEAETLQADLKSRLEQLRLRRHQAAGWKPIGPVRFREGSSVILTYSSSIDAINETDRSGIIRISDGSKEWSCHLVWVEVKGEQSNASVTLFLTGDECPARGTELWVRTVQP